MVQFLKYRFASLVFSTLLLSAFVATAIYNYKNFGQVFSYSIDFTGGTQTLLRFSVPVGSEQVRQILAHNGFEGIDTRSFSENEVMVRVKEYASDAKGLGDRIRATLQENMPDLQVTILQSESVGPAVGQTLRTKSVRAIVIALILMLAYIAIRFWSFAFAVGAVVALFHDALIMLAMFLFLNKEISIYVIGAILAVLGYSINDTIVIFSQIRENIGKMKGRTLNEIVNASLNQTLKRTILTSVSTGLPVLAMLLFGGDALFNLSFALLVGIIFGTYSSIYIASPVMMMLYNKKD